LQFFLSLLPQRKKELAGTTGVAAKSFVVEALSDIILITTLVKFTEKQQSDDERATQYPDSMQCASSFLACFTALARQQAICLHFRLVFDATRAEVNWHKSDDDALTYLRVLSSKKILVVTIIILLFQLFYSLVTL